MNAIFKYTYHCPTCEHDCVTYFYEEPFANATITCCCNNDIRIDHVDTEKRTLFCSSLVDMFVEYLNSK